jgi:polysaccharide export outer membrane protein
MRNFLSVCRFLTTFGLFLAFTSTLLTSCGNTRHLTYLQGQFDTTKLSQINLKEPVIQKGDILSILIYSDNPATTAIFNQAQSGGSSGSSSTGGGNSSSSGGSGGSTGGGGSSSGGGGQSGGGSQGSGGYLVDEKGNIEIQTLGHIHVDSMTRSQLRDTLEKKLTDYLSNPYVTIRFLNYRFTMLGEVMRPGVFSISNEHVNLMEALGMAGDLTFFGRRDNILVIRQTDGQRKFGRLDMTTPNVMASPFFNLEPNDIVYVEASRKKIAANDQTLTRNITIAATIVSTIALLVALFRN